MPNWQSEMIRDEERLSAQRRALHNPFGMLAKAVSSYDESAKFDFYGARDRKISIIHPFMSGGSWIRAMPEDGSTFVGMYRVDENNPQPVTTYQRGTIKRLNSYRAKEAYYRELMPGEIELHSRGVGQLFLPRRPKAELRGGIINRWIDQDRLEVGDRSPIHRRQFFLNRSNQLGDEERLGIISRPKQMDNASANASVAGGGTSFSSWELSYPKVRNNFAAEWYVNLKSPGRTTPTDLFTIQKGHVLDEEGGQIQQSVTQIPLRSIEEYFANDDTSTKTEIDEKGNWYTELTSSALEGWQLDILGGNYKKNVELDEEIAVNRNSKHTTAKSRYFDVGENWKVNVRKNIEITSEENGGSLYWNSTPGAEQIVWRSKSGHYFTMDDTSGSEAVYLMHNSGAQIVLSPNGTVKMLSKNGNSVAMDSDSKAITATSGQGAFITLSDVVTLSDSSGAQVVTLDGSDTLQVTSKKTVNLSAQNVTLAGGNVNLGNFAALSAVLAEPLAILFDTHFHAAPLGPTSPPLPPTTAALMNANPATSFASAYVKMRTNLA